MTAMANVAHGVSVTDVLLGAASGQELREALERYATEKNPRGTWWLEAEQSDGFVVGRWHDGRLEVRGSLPGVELDPRALLDLRYFTRGHELRVAGGMVLRAWARVRELPEPAWPFTPRVRQYLLIEPGVTDAPKVDSVFSELTRLSGERTILPEPWPTDDELIKVVREYFAEDESGNVRVAMICNEAYEARGRAHGS